MKNILLGTLREIGIAIIIIVVLAAVTVFVFKDQLPYDEVIPSGEKYARIDRRTYSVNSTDRISEINAVTITHEANQRQIINAEDDVRIQTGKYTPFEGAGGINDLPSERVGVISSGGNTSEGSSNSNDTNDDGEVLNYSDYESDPIGTIEAEQSESSESALNRRAGI